MTESRRDVRAPGRRGGAIEHRLRRSLGVRGRDVGGVRARVSTGAAGTRCRIRLSVHGCWHLVVDEHDAVAAAAIERAIDRVVRWVREIAGGTHAGAPPA